MRRASFTPSFKASIDEPLIVVDETEELEAINSNKSSLDDDDEDRESPKNPYLLSPFRDPRETRKHSLPNLQCPEICASQMRRLSDGGEAGPSATEVEFLTQLSQGQSSAGRRHSIVTISKVPPILFGRNRRESFAAFTCSGSENESALSRFNKHRGSIHNLQLDIMDGIAQVGKV